MVSLLISRHAATRKRLLIGLVVSALVVVAIVLGLYFGLWANAGDEVKLSHGAVTANGFECAAIGR